MRAAILTTSLLPYLWDSKRIGTANPRSRRGNEAEIICSHKIRLVTSEATLPILEHEPLGKDAFHRVRRRCDPKHSPDDLEVVPTGFIARMKVNSRKEA